MRRLPVIPLAALALVIPASAQASPIRECGRGYSTAPYPNPVHNITTRMIRCSDAKRMVDSAAFIGYGNYVFHSRLTTRHRWRCRVRVPQPFDRHGNGSYRVDVRCTYWLFVVRWQYDSGE